jgi:hypothetical protein
MLSPQFVIAVVFTTAAGMVMLRVGFGSGGLRSRAQGRRCVSCGRRIDANICPNCSQT